MAAVKRDVFAVHLQIERLAFEQGEDHVFFTDGDFNQTAAVVDVEGVACPCARQERSETEFAAPRFFIWAKPWTMASHEPVMEVMCRPSSVSLL